MKYIVIIEKPLINSIDQQITLLVADRSDLALNTIFCCQEYKIFDKQEDALQFLHDKITNN